MVTRKTWHLASTGNPTGDLLVRCGDAEASSQTSLGAAEAQRKKQLASYEDEVKEMEAAQTSLQRLWSDSRLDMTGVAYWSERCLAHSEKQSFLPLNLGTLTGTCGRLRFPAHARFSPQASAAKQDALELVKKLQRRHSNILNLGLLVHTTLTNRCFFVCACLFKDGCGDAPAEEADARDDLEAPRRRCCGGGQPGDRPRPEQRSPQCAVRCLRGAFECRRSGRCAVVHEGRASTFEHISAAAFECRTPSSRI